VRSPPGSRGFITVEINLGQVHYEVERCAGGKAPAYLVGSAGGKIIHPDKVMDCPAGIQENILTS
jgi:2-oxoglutarate/2-oxoacid ferredoxin oxidoreductase subunit alpha